MERPGDDVFMEMMAGRISPDAALDSIVDSLHSTPEPDEELIDELGVGPLESLLRAHEQELWPRVERLARDDIRFRRALRGVWAYDSPYFERRDALLEELGESEATCVRFVVERSGFGQAEELDWRAVEVEGTVDDVQLATLFRDIADWLERERPHDTGEH
ncbi:MAG TPA: hypothetical protein VIB48_16035 [Acidimicrobiia bacterium]|jgi:hypothetical protein